MNNIKKTILSLLSFLLIFSAALTPLYPQDVQKDISVYTILPAMDNQEINELISSGKYLKFHGSGFTPGLMPNTDISSQIYNLISKQNMNIGLEGLFFFPDSSLPPAFSSMPKEERNIKLYNILRSVSTLQGLEYYSASRKKMRTLFEESWAVSDPSDSKTKIPDPVVNTIPAMGTIYIYQKDKTFGKNFSRMEFRAGEKTFSSTIINITPMRYKGFIKVIDKENLQINFIIIPTTEGLLVYGAMGAETLNIKAFLDKAENSFKNRVIALSSWYEKRMQEEFH